MLKIGINAARGLFTGHPLRQRLQMLDNFLEIFERFREKNEQWYVELGISAFPEVYKQRLDKVDIDKPLILKIRRLVSSRKFNLTIHAPHVPEPVLPDMNLCSLREKERKLSVNYAIATIKLAELFESRIITFHPGFLYSILSPTQDMYFSQSFLIRKAKDMLIKSLNELIPVAEKFGIIITIENMEPRLDIGYILTHPIEVKEIIERVNSEQLKITYDTAHAALSSTYYKFDQIKNFKELVKYVVKIHIHDNFRRPGLYGRKDLKEGIGDLHLTPLIGKGSVPNEDILRIGKNKLIIYELTPLEVEFMHSVNNLRRLLKHSLS
jgi:sugar phosphate isomerase/epimerase